MKVTLLDTKTGEQSVVDDPQLRSWIWSDGNWSCDCNRHMYFGEEDDDLLEEQRLLLGLEEGICIGNHRFIIVAAEKNSEEDYECTLKELNEHYPDELLARFGVK